MLSPPPPPRYNIQLCTSPAAVRLPACLHSSSSLNLVAGWLEELHINFYMAAQLCWSACAFLVQQQKLTESWHNKKGTRRPINVLLLCFGTWSLSLASQSVSPQCMLTDWLEEMWDAVATSKSRCINKVMIVQKLSKKPIFITTTACQQGAHNDSIRLVLLSGRPGIWDWAWGQAPECSHLSISNKCQ